MASCVKEENEQCLEADESVESQVNNSHTYSHNPDEFIDIHGTHIISKDSSTSSCEQENSASSEQRASSSRVFQDTSDHFGQLSSTQNLTHGLKLPVQETEGTNIGGTVVHHDSDEEYQSAEDGEGEYNSDDEEDDFIPTAEMLTLNEESETKDIASPEACTSNSSCDADESESEEALAENGEVLPEEEDVAEADPLEARRTLEEALTTEEKQVCGSKNLSHFYFFNWKKKGIICY